MIGEIIALPVEFFTQKKLPSQRKHQDFTLEAEKVVSFAATLKMKKMLLRTAKNFFRLNLNPASLNLIVDEF